MFYERLVNYYLIITKYQAFLLDAYNMFISYTHSPMAHKENKKSHYNPPKL